MGKALAVAVQQMIADSAPASRRRVLVVISDGMAIDRAAAEASLRLARQHGILTQMVLVGALANLAPLPEALTSRPHMLLQHGFSRFADVVPSLGEEICSLAKQPPPTGAPTLSLTARPTEPPSAAPSAAPSNRPTTRPTGAPSFNPTGAPTSVPTGAPTSVPTMQPLTPAPTSIGSGIGRGSGDSKAPTVAPTGRPPISGGSGIGGGSGDRSAGSTGGAAVRPCDPCKPKYWPVKFAQERTLSYVKQIATLNTSLKRTKDLMARQSQVIRQLNAAIDQCGQATHATKRAL